MSASAKTVVTCAIIACRFAAILAGVAKIIVKLFWTWLHVQLDGYIVWDAHNTVLGEEALLILSLIHI